MRHIDAYLDRLGLDRESPSARADALDRLHRRHVERVPYETTWIHLGEPWSIGPDEAVERIATAGRGGYCFHLNGALSTLLAALGYHVTLHVGGVHRGEPDVADLCNHLVLLVHDLPTSDHPDGTWYVDTGLGDALHGPVPLRAGDVPARSVHLPARTDAARPCRLALHARPGGLVRRHEFLRPRQRRSMRSPPATSSSHGRPNRRSPAPSPHSSATTRERPCFAVLRFTRTDRAGTTERLVDDREAWLDLLATTFRIDLSAASAEAIARMWEQARAAAATRPRNPSVSKETPDMIRYICTTCGTQYADRIDPPSACAICSDDRQYVGWSGQHWTTLEELQAAHTVRFDVDDGLVGIGITPAFGIPQRSLVLPTSIGNILWETTSLVSGDAVAELEARGGIEMIVISHPHFYASMVEWSDAFGGVPIVLHANDREWIARPSEHIELWEGDVYELSADVTLHRCPGHFPGSTVLHSASGPHGRPILLAGDALHVAQDRRHVSFMYSVPNHVPSHPDDVDEIRHRLDGVDFDDLYGFTWGLNIIGEARSCVDESFDRYFRAVGRSVSRR